jgi:hypothetical protein
MDVALEALIAIGLLGVGAAVRLHQRGPRYRSRILPRAGSGPPA